MCSMCWSNPSTQPRCSRLGGAQLIGQRGLARLLATERRVQIAGLVADVNVEAVPVPDPHPTFRPRM